MIQIKQYGTVSTDFYSIYIYIQCIQMLELSFQLLLIFNTL
jgi:hypothetical protein